MQNKLSHLNLKLCIQWEEAIGSISYSNMVKDQWEPFIITFFKSFDAYFITFIE